MYTAVHYWAGLMRTKMPCVRSTGSSTSCCFIGARGSLTPVCVDISRHPSPRSHVPLRVKQSVFARFVVMTWRLEAHCCRSMLARRERLLLDHKTSGRPLCWVLARLPAPQRLERWGTLAKAACLSKGKIRSAFAAWIQLLQWLQQLQQRRLTVNAVCPRH